MSAFVLRALFTAGIAAILAGPVSAVTWSRECDTACTDYHTFKDDLDSVKDICEADSNCKSIVDFSGNEGLFAVCKPTTEYRAWPKVCVERKEIDEL
mmetsp:Transcript_76338/g.150981  ORF Transcript_76338/g.150981 Transcript_76338/m.150981 type:complete len:97 (-) Transcript_76338:157-447(-)|eukprot:CAMPEP_0172716880 /NCGR_PEP_ID=MMETSP1074-20121228/69643_1 /TAXON_ID=2916 /ORGANISM="Ceratium fusus, Strain PA161109" /LENGTH=96 /DNA_ID=CAMNT_0013541685 /DNA_START=62 /DNA_END=352 /DNA_ORIENTATION=-